MREVILAQLSTGSPDCGALFTGINTTQHIVLGGANTITLQGSPTGGDIIAGNGTSVTTIDGKNGDVNVGGNLSVNGITGSVDMGGLAVHNVGTPVNGTDAANKAYVDSVVNGGNKTFTNLTVTGVTNLNGGVTVTGASNLNGVATFTNTAVAGQGSSQINGAVITLTNGTNPSQTITLNANADPLFQVNGGTAATTTTINNGAVSAGTSVTVGTNAANQTTINNGTVTAVTVNAASVNAGNLTVASGGNIDMGGNQIHGVAAGVAPTDAVNVSQLGSAVNTLNQRIDKANEGVSIAMALASPIFQPGQRFVIQGGWGGFQGTDAFGVSAAGLVARDTFGAGSTVTVSAGVGAGTNSGTVAGRAAVAIGW